MRRIKKLRQCKLPEGVNGDYYISIELKKPVSGCDFVLSDSSYKSKERLIILANRET